MHHVGDLGGKRMLLHGGQEKQCFRGESPSASSSGSEPSITAWINCQRFAMMPPASGLLRLLLDDMVGGVRSKVK